MHLHKILGRNLRAIQKERGLSADAFANLLDISKTALKMYLSDKGNPTLKTIGIMAGKLGISPEELLSINRSEQQTSKVRMVLSSLPPEHRQVIEEAIIGYVVNLFDL